MTILKVALAPAQNLERTAGRNAAAERGWLEVTPEIGFRRGNEGEVGVVINPGDFADAPFAPAELLQPDECVVEHVVGGGQNLMLANNGADLLHAPHLLAPRLVIVVLLAGNLDSDDGVFPGRGRAIPGGFGRSGG